MSLGLSKAKKEEIIAKYGVNKQDTGSSKVQVVLLSARIDELTRHLKQASKDRHSTRGLLALVAQRRRLLDYLKRTNLAAYTALVKELHLRK